MESVFTDKVLAKSLSVLEYPLLARSEHSHRGRLWNAFDQEPRIERKTVRMNQLPTRRL